MKKVLASYSNFAKSKFSMIHNATKTYSQSSWGNNKNRLTKIYTHHISNFCIYSTPISRKFKFNDDFIDLYRHKDTNFGFNGLGELVYRRTYSRLKEDGTNEQWWETVQRVVEGTFNLLLSHLEQNAIKIDRDTLETINVDSKIMFEKIFNFKFLPPGRGLWSMGTSITEDKKIFAALNNCAFVSTKPTDKTNIDEVIKPYLFLMDNAMLGVGVGFDTKGSGMGIKIYSPKKSENNESTFFVKDSREGWVESVAILLKCYLQENMILPNFDYSIMRAAGIPLKVFGGISSGPGPLKDLHSNLIELLDKFVGHSLDSRLIVDVMNLIGKSVVSGNISIIEYIIFFLFREDSRNRTRRSRRQYFHRTQKL
jgi:ribonucleoside-triphosphate reductase